MIFYQTQSYVPRVQYSLRLEYNPGYKRPSVRGAQGSHLSLLGKLICTYYIFAANYRGTCGTDMVSGVIKGGEWMPLVAFSRGKEILDKKRRKN